MFTVEQFWGGNGSPDADQENRPIVEGAFYVVKLVEDGGEVYAGPFNWRMDAWDRANRLNEGAGEEAPECISCFEPAATDSLYCVSCGLVQA